MRINQITENDNNSTFGYDLEDNTQSKLFMLRCILEVMKQKLPEINIDQVINDGHILDVLNINKDNRNSRLMNFGLGFTIYDILNLRKVATDLAPAETSGWAIFWRVMSDDNDSYKDKLNGLSKEINDEMKEADLPYQEPYGGRSIKILNHNNFTATVKSYINTRLQGSGYALKIQVVTDLYGPVMKMKIVEYQAPNDVKKLKDFKTAIKQNKFEAFRAKYKISKMDFARMMINNIVPKNQTSEAYKEKFILWLSKTLGDQS